MNIRAMDARARELVREARRAARTGGPPDGGDAHMGDEDDDDFGGTLRRGPGQRPPPGMALRRAAQNAAPRPKPAPPSAPGAGGLLAAATWHTLPGKGHPPSHAHMPAPPIGAVPKASPSSAGTPPRPDEVPFFNAKHATPLGELSGALPADLSDQPLPLRPLLHEPIAATEGAADCRRVSRWTWSPRAAYRQPGARISCCRASHYAA